MIKILIYSLCSLLLIGCSNNNLIARLMSKADNLCISQGKGTAIYQTFQISERINPDLKIVQLTGVQCANGEWVSELVVRHIND